MHLTSEYLGEYCCFYLKLLSSSIKYCLGAVFVRNGCRVSLMSRIGLKAAHVNDNPGLRSFLDGLWARNVPQVPVGLTAGWFD